MIRRRFLIFFTSGLSWKFLFFAGWVLVASSQVLAVECRPLIEQKCASCHFVTHVCPDIAKKKGAWTWKRTIKSMVEHGTDLTDTQAKQLVGCLSKPDGKVLDICAKKIEITAYLKWWAGKDSQGMAIRLLAVELYKSQQKVHALRDELENATGVDSDRLRRELAVAEHECEQLRRRIDARKDLYR